MTHVSGLAEIVLWTADKSKALDFYQNLLGFELISPPSIPNAFLKVSDGKAGIPQMIVLVPLPDKMKSEESKALSLGHQLHLQLHHLAFELPADAFDAQQQALIDAGFAPRGGIHPVIASRTMYIDDPDGNEVEFICQASESE